MLNDDDVKSLNKLLHIMKDSKKDSVLEVSYSGKHGWHVNVEDEDWYESSYFKKQRLGSLCLDKIVDLIQERLNGDAQ